jgi:O-antigen biosynthesis protein WbqV
MTIKEAVELILQASAMGSRKNEQKQGENNANDIALHGKIFVLEMGEPVKIVDLAKQVIKLAGLKPDIDIKIAYTGLRPGEKLFEEIFHGKEDFIKTESKGILLAEPRAVDKQELAKKIEELENLCNKNDDEQAKALLKELVPEFKNPK